MTGVRKREKVTGQMITRLILKHATPKADMRRHYFMEYFLSGTSTALAIVYFLNQLKATIFKEGTSSIFSYFLLNGSLLSFGVPLLLLSVSLRRKRMKAEVER